MDLEDYRTVFTSVGFALMLVAASPILSILFPLSLDGERFPELWVLGPNHKAEEYPINVAVGEETQVFLVAGNHVGHSVYYVVYVKLRNQTQDAPNSATAVPSSFAPLYTFRTVVADDETREFPVRFSFLDTSRFGNSLVVKRMRVEDVVSSLDQFSLWDTENHGFFYQLFFELWIYDEASSRLRYDRFVDLWLNMTG